MKPNVSFSWQRLAMILGVILILSPKSAHAQFTAPEASGTGSVPSLKTSGPQKSQVTVNPEALVFQGPIDPKEYRIGPGDLMEMHLWTTGEIIQVNVSPDERLVVPHVGEFDVHNKSLETVRSEVEQQALQIFKTSKSINNGDPISLLLLQPRRIYVNVKGDVNFPGTYTFTGATRVDLGVDLANRAQQQQTPLFADEARLREIDQQRRETEKLRPYLGTTEESTASERYITVVHSDGSSDHVDLLRYAGTRDSRYCPLLRGGDEIFVPYKKRLEGQIGIYGAVMAPGTYEYVAGDSLYAMIRNVYGTTATADLRRVEVTRMSPSGTDFRTLYYDVVGIKNNPSTDIPLMRGDRIFVRDTIDVREVARVTLKGEVRQPGVYPIQPGVTKLSWIIKNSGGFTPTAFLGGGSVTRKRLDLETDDITPEQDATEVTRLANLSVSDTTNFKLQTTLRNGIANIDMNRLFVQGDSTADLTLRDGDVISIPTVSNDVRVWGYVGRSGYVPYLPGAKLQHYIDLAGGYAEGSVRSGTRIIKARTRQFLDPDQTQIEQGDEIYVPKTSDHSENYTLNTIGAVAGIVGGIVSTILAIFYFTRRP